MSLTPDPSELTKARALWIECPGVCALRSEPLPIPDAESALVRTLYSGVSRGTESLVFAGNVPADQAEAMRAPFQSGSLPGPVKYGYSAVGVVEQGPDDLLGRTVFCLHPHQDRFVAPVTSLVPLSESASSRRGVLAANLETAMTVVWDGAPGPGDRIAVIGAGVVGALAAYLCARIPGTSVTLIDVLPERARIAEVFGCAFSEPDQAPADCDLVIHASASEAGLATALGCAGVEATVIEASWYGEAAPRAALGAAFHSRRLSLRSSQVGRIPAARTPRWTHRRRLETAVALADDTTLDNLLNGETRFENLADEYSEIVARPGALCHVIAYD